jgi:hypothetical protein
MNYAYHTMDTIQYIISNPSFCPSGDFSNKSYSGYGNMCLRIYRILAHTSYNHSEVYLKYENEYSLCTRFLTFCLQFQFMKTKEICHKKQIFVFPF